MRNKEVTEKIIEKIQYVLDGINCRSSREADLMTAQTAHMLSEVYKNVKEAENEIN